MSTMSQRSHLPDSEAWRVVGRLEGGQTQAEVAQAIGVSQSVISRTWNRFLETESAGRRPGQGRRRTTTPNEDRYLVLTARRHRNMNATLLQQLFISIDILNVYFNFDFSKKSCKGLSREIFFLD
ncbi:HTH_Tnp_Tc3_2 domain-containing protein [Trichonephila clavipes]|nr:HTH_Tnp_Tc3_2 domain-containing protein [Trichonephila clavipes]